MYLGGTDLFFLICFLPIQEEFIKYFSPVCIHAAKPTSSKFLLSTPSQWSTDRARLKSLEKIPPTSRKPTFTHWPQNPQKISWAAQLDWEHPQKLSELLVHAPLLPAQNRPYRGHRSKAASSHTFAQSAEFYTSGSSSARCGPFPVPCRVPRVATAAPRMLRAPRIPADPCRGTQRMLHELQEQLQQEPVKQICWGIWNPRTALPAQEVLGMLIAGSWESGLGGSHRALAAFWCFYLSISCWRWQRLHQRLHFGLSQHFCDPTLPKFSFCILPKFSPFFSNNSNEFGVGFFFPAADAVWGILSPLSTMICTSYAIHC